MKNKVFEKLLTAYSSLILKESKINVSTLCQKADVGRATFYLYYKDIEDYINSCEDYIISKLIKQLELIISADENEVFNVIKKENMLFKDYEVNLLQHFTNRDSYLVFMKKSYPFSLEIIKKYAEKKFGKKFIEDNYKTLDYFFSGYFTLIYFNVLDYNEDVFRSDIENIIKLAKKLIYDINQKNQ